MIDDDSTAVFLADYRERAAAVNTLKTADEKREARRALTTHRRRKVEAVAGKCLSAALGEEGVGTEGLVWFWFNHFNVFWRKEFVGAALPSYLDDAIRPHANGRFRDLLLAALTHPAMLVYLDNHRNVAGKLNENLARELLELHTLGVDGGYSQQDVHAVARILTGCGLRPLRPVRWPPKLQGHVVSRGEFLFDPRRHDFRAKRVLGRRIEAQGYAEVEALVDLLAGHPRTARHIAGKLSSFLLGDEAPSHVVDDAARVFSATGGDLVQVVAAIRGGGDALPPDRPDTFKDPYRWLLSSLRLLAAGHRIKDRRSPQRWLTALGQPLFGCQTPDGYSLQGSDWVSSGQLAQRFELASEMVGSLPRLSGGAVALEDVLRSPGVTELESRLGGASLRALSEAEARETRLALLISSPEFMFW